MESRSERIIGHETLGMQHQSFNPECLNYGKILLPPVLTAQLEVIMTAKILQPEVKEVLRLLTKLMKKQQKRQSWLAIYLSIFILLHSKQCLSYEQNTLTRLIYEHRKYFKNIFLKQNFGICFLQK